VKENSPGRKEDKRMESYTCAVKDKSKNIEKPVLAALFISALCFAGTDSVNFTFFVLTKIVSLVLVLIVCLVWSKRPLIPWQRFGKVIALYMVNSANKGREILARLAFDKKGSEKTIKVADITPLKGISSRKRRRSYGPVRRNPAIEQLSLW
jgi:hypothetical protein